MHILMLLHQQGWLACVAAGWDGHKAQQQTLMLARAGGPLSGPFEDRDQLVHTLAGLGPSKRVAAAPPG